MKTNCYRHQSRIRRLLLVGLVAATFSTGTGEAEAQSRHQARRTAALHDTATLARSAIHIRVNGKRFYYDRGVFYRKVKGRFVLSAVPLGGIVRRLPRASRLVVVHGRRYYMHNGIYFFEVRRGFRIVQPPAGARFGRAWIGFSSRGVLGYVQIPAATYAWSTRDGYYRVAFDRWDGVNDWYDDAGKRGALNEARRRDVPNEAGVRGALNNAGKRSVLKDDGRREALSNDRLDNPRASTMGRGSRTGKRGRAQNG